MSKIWVCALILALGWLASTGVANAGDAASLSILGFSKDGTLLAWEQFGFHDGDGSPFSKVYLTDVGNNRHLFYYSVTRSPSRPGHRIEPTSEALLEAVRSDAHVHLSMQERYSEIVASDGGTTVVSRLLTDISSRHFARFLMNPTGDAYSQTQSGYTLTLEERPAVDRGGEALKCGTPGLSETARNALQFTLTFKDTQNNALRILQRDSHLPMQARGCTTGYWIQSVISHSNLDGSKSLVVFLNTFIYPAFEGSDMRLMAVTSILH